MDDADRTLTTYQGFYANSIANPDAFWAKQAELIEWQKKPAKILEYTKPPFRKWFVGGETNLCFNEVETSIARTSRRSSGSRPRSTRSAPSPMRSSPTR